MQFQHSRRAMRPLFVLGRDHIRCPRIPSRATVLPPLVSGHDAQHEFVEHRDGKGGILVAGTPNHPLDSQLVAGGSKRCQGRRDVGPSGLGTPRRRLRQPRPESGSMRGLRGESYGVPEKSQEKGSSAYEPQPLLTWTNLPRRTRAGDPPSRPTGPGQIGAATPFRYFLGPGKSEKIYQALH